MDRLRVVLLLGTAQTLSWASSFYLAAVLAAPMARDTGLATPTVYAMVSAALMAAALVGPAAGRAIDRHGGRPVLMASNAVLMAALAALALAQGPVSLALGWLLLGLGMGCGLYDAAFAALVALYGRDSRRSITGVTLIAGFASTVGWPLSAWMASRWGWRGACGGWAVLQLAVALPLNAGLSRAVGGGAGAHPRRVEAGAENGNDQATGAPPPRSSRAPAVLLALMFTLTGVVGTAMAAHLPALLQAAGTGAGAAVALAALVGPAQVAARLIEFGLLRRASPLWSARAATLGHPLGALLLLVAGPAAALPFVLLHGMGNGLTTIVKGTLPLALFGADGYGARQGWISLPARLLGALTPWLFGWCVDRWGAGALLLSGALGVGAFGVLLALRLPASPIERSR